MNASSGLIGIIGEIIKIIKFYVFNRLVGFGAYMGLGKVWIAPKGCGEAPGHFPHQDKLYRQVFVNRVFPIGFFPLGRVLGLGPGPGAHPRGRI